MITVIIPSYNHEYYIGHAINSVLNQSFDSFELIIIDDASEDKSWDIIKSYSDKRIRTIKLSSNHGAYYVQNKGIELAKYEYIAILNSDDLFSRDRLKKCLNFLQNNSVDFIGSDIELVDNEGNVINKNWWTDSFNKQKEKLLENNDWFRSLFAGNIFMTTSNFFFRKSIFNALGGFNCYKYVLDYDFLLRTLFSGFRFHWINEPLLKYRLHDKNTINSNPLKANQEATQLIRKFLSKLPCRDKSISNSIREGVFQLRKFEMHIEQILTSDFVKMLDVRNAMLFDRDRWITERDQIISDLDKCVIDRDKWITERDQIISDLDNCVTDRDKWITERDQIISDLDKCVTDRDKWITERDQIISDLDKCVTDRDKWITERDQIISDLDKCVTDRDKWITERDNMIADRDRWITERDEFIESRDKNIQQLKTDLKKIKSSFIYKITEVISRPFHLLFK